MFAKDVVVPSCFCVFPMLSTFTRDLKLRINVYAYPAGRCFPRMNRNAYHVAGHGRRNQTTVCSRISMPFFQGSFEHDQRPASLCSVFHLALLQGRVISSAAPRGSGRRGRARGGGGVWRGGDAWKKNDRETVKSEKFKVKRDGARIVNCWMPTVLGSSKCFHGLRLDFRVS